MVTNDNSKAPKQKRKTRVLAKDVAKMAGVSQGTVSRVLSRAKSDLISEATRKRVFEAAKTLGYTPNPFAQALRGKQTHLLGVILREISDPFFSKVISELNRQAKQMGYHIVLSHVQSDPNEALIMTNVLDTRHMDGVFILGDLRQDEPALDEILRFHPAAVALCRGASPAPILTVNTDNQAGVTMLMNHLMECGHRRFGFVDGGWLGDIQERRDAFCAYVSEKRLEVVPEWVQIGENSSEGGYQAMKRILALSHRPTAVLASDDVMAIGVIKAITDAGMSIPKDISVVGFDNIEFCGYLCPSLTTIQQPIEEMCRKSLGIILKRINSNGENLPSRRITRLKPELIIRQSSGVAPA